MRSDWSYILWVEHGNAEDRSKPRACQEATIKSGHDAHMCFKAIEIRSLRKGSTMRTIIGGALLALTITTANSAVEEDVHSARFMLPYCKLTSKQTMASTKNALIYGQCFGVVSGIVMMVEVLRQAASAGKAQFDPVLCTDIPGNATMEQLVNVVVKYGSTHPDQGHERLEVVAFNALRDAWPCTK
jgi:Rap1a immunity proteins